MNDTLTFTQGQSVIFDGDSLTCRRSKNKPDTWPFLRLMNWDKSWADMFAEMLFCWRPELELSFYNGALGGSHCRDVMERFDHNVLSRKPDWVLLTLAGNDASQGIPEVEYRELMTTYARRLTDEAGAQVLFYGFSTYTPDYPHPDSIPQRRAYFDILADIATLIPGVHYRDIGPAFTKKAAALLKQHPLHTVYSDGGHLNAVGNMIIAGEMLNIFGIVP